MNDVKKRMGAMRTKRPRRSHSNKGKSFRTLAAFGLWANRDDVENPVLFTSRLRRRMEHGNTAS